MADPPTFFFSHSRQDRVTSPGQDRTPGGLIRKFFDDLQMRLANASAYRIGSGSDPTFDDQIQLGADWVTRLGGRVATDNVLLAMISPSYVGLGTNCGKELGEFLLRSPALKIDSAGQLGDAQNVFIVRWFKPGFYHKNGEKDGRIPLFLRRVNDMLPSPQIANADPLLSAAISFYRTYGMEACVDHAPDYMQLLDALALAIRDARDLQPGPVKDWNDMIDAFQYDWGGHFGVAPQAAVATAEPLRPLTSVAVFYITRRPFETSPVIPPYADRLIAEPAPGQQQAGTDQDLAKLLVDVHGAMSSEPFQVVHCTASPAVPTESGPMIERLHMLSRRKILTILVIDPDLLTGADLPVLRQIVDAETWTGPVLLPMFPNAKGGTADILDPKGRLVYSVPWEAKARKSLVVSILLNLRRQITAEARFARPVANEAMPQLQTPGRPPP
jgi:hypothetical protein